MLDFALMKNKMILHNFKLCQQPGLLWMWLHFVYSSFVFVMHTQSSNCHCWKPAILHAELPAKRLLFIIKYVHLDNYWPKILYTQIHFTNFVRNNIINKKIRHARLCSSGMVLKSVVNVAFLILMSAFIWWIKIIINK